MPAARRLLSFFRANRLPVVHLRFASALEGATDMLPLWRLCFDQHAEDSGKSYSPAADSPEMGFIDALAPLDGETALTKVTGSGFLSTNLDEILRSREMRSFIACGVWLNSCVEDTIRTGCDLGYLVTLAEDASAAPDEEFHRAAVRVLGEMYCQVRESGWIIERMERLMAR